MRNQIATLTLGLFVSCAGVAQAQDAQSWCKSKWGADDEKGAANHLTPQLALEAAKIAGPFAGQKWARRDLRFTQGPVSLSH
jgi:hypothetical protein